MCAAVGIFVETSEGSRSVLLSAFLCYAPSGHSRAVSGPQATV